MTKTKSGRELGVTKGQKGPAYARRFFAWFGITEGGSESDTSDE